MIGPTPFRDIFIVAGFEVREMLRTRRALVLIALYLCGGLVAAYFFVEMLGRLEAAAADALGTTSAARPGALMKQLMQEEAYRSPIRRMFRDPQVADYLLGLPPISLFYAWISFTFVPPLIMITASDTIAQERQSRGIRFVAFRTGRLEFVVGKTLGQALLMAVVTLLTGTAYIVVAWNGLQGFELVPTLSAIVSFWPRIVLYGVSFLGLSALCSMNASSTNTARVFSLIGLMGMWMLNGLSKVYRDGPYSGIWEFVTFLIPYSHQEDLWSPSLQAVTTTGLLLVALGTLYLGAGLLVFSRRDV